MYYSKTRFGLPRATVADRRTVDQNVMLPYKTTTSSTKSLLWKNENITIHNSITNVDPNTTIHVIMVQLDPRSRQHPFSKMGETFTD